MKKTISLFLLTALCLCILTSCDMGNGLVSELFGISPDIDPVPEYMTTEVPLCDCGEPMYENHQCFIPPDLVQTDYLSVGVQYADGSVKELMDAKELLEWNGELEVEYAPDAYLYIKGFSACKGTEFVQFKCDVEGSKSEQSTGFDLSEYADLYSPIECDVMYSFYHLIPLDALEFENEVSLYTTLPDITGDRWNTYTSLHIMMVPGTESKIETEIETEIDIESDCEGTLPPDCMEEPTEEMTASPATDETAAQDH